MSRFCSHDSIVSTKSFDIKEGRDIPDKELSIEEDKVSVVSCMNTNRDGFLILRSQSIGTVTIRHEESLNCFGYDF